AAEKVDNADLFRALVYLTTGTGRLHPAARQEDREVAAKTFADVAHKRLTTKPEQPAGPRYAYDYESRFPAAVHPSEFLFASLCLADPKLVTHCERLPCPMLAQAQSTQNTEYRAR